MNDIKTESKTVLNNPLQQWWGTDASRPWLVAGPCSAETADQVMETARGIASWAPQAVFRAGLWKPRTRPGSFEGVGNAGLAWLQQVKAETGLRTATEVATPAHLEACVNAGIDLVWIGARTVANPFSVQALADALRDLPQLPVLVKNPINLDLELWTGALERMQQAGITRLGAIHRGFHALNPNEYRNPPHWDLVIQFRTRFPEVPLLCDPSHISGSPNLLPQVAQKALDLDAVGLMIETHINPTKAWSDAAQQITPEHLKQMVEALHVRQPNSPNPVFRDKLEALRKEIDGLDAELLNVLARRMSISRKIGAYKEAHHITIFQLERWMQVLRDQKQWGILAGFSEEFIQRFYEAVHQESIRVQTEAQNRSTGPTKDSA